MLVIFPTGAPRCSRVLWLPLRGPAFRAVSGALRASFSDAARALAGHVGSRLAVYLARCTSAGRAGFACAVGVRRASVQVVSVGSKRSPMGGVDDGKVVGGCGREPELAACFWAGAIEKQHRRNGRRCRRTTITPDALQELLDGSLDVGGNTRAVAYRRQRQMTGGQSLGISTPRTRRIQAWPQAHAITQEPAW